MGGSLLLSVYPGKILLEIKETLIETFGVVQTITLTFLREEADFSPDKVRQ